MANHGMSLSMGKSQSHFKDDSERTVAGNHGRVGELVASDS
ncbi:hypothetical protein [Planctopirus hydrillae]|nr:hypothetical protein [Planctopirus hydrillae]